MRISVEGLIGVGKTTFVNHFSSLSTFKPLYESVEGNPFLSRFYEDPKRWAFTLQMYFLYDRYKNHCAEGNVLLDRSLYGDICFANILQKQEVLTSDEHYSYLDHFQVLESHTPPLDICIHLDISSEEALSRIHKRNRSFETSISLDYLNLLQDQLQLLPEYLPHTTKYIRIPWTEMNEEEIAQKVSEVISSYSL